MYLSIGLLFFVIAPSFQKDENKLLGNLTADYSPSARPVRNINKPVVVTFGFELVHIVEVAETEQTVTQKIWLRMSWLNELLTWNVNEWGGVTKTRLDPSNVWTPDIFLQEDVSDSMSEGPEKYRTQVAINSDGKCTWLVPALLQSSCIFDVQNFPFDRQSCTLLFTSWTHDETELDLKIDERPVVDSHYIKSSEWEVESITRERRSNKYACCPNPYVDIKYTTHLRRKPLYYVYNVIVPCIIQMIIILFTFFLPPDSGERIGVVITVLLVFAVYLEVISDFLPKTSNSTPALAEFYITVMAESAMSLIATCIVLIIHYRGTEKGVGPMPQWMRKYFIDGFAKYFCIRRLLREHTDEGLLALDEKGSYTGVNNIGLNQVEQEEKVKSRNPPITMETLVQEVRVITSLINDMNRQDEIEEEWQILGKVFDRIFFFVFLIIFFVTSLVFLLPMSY